MCAQIKAGDEFIYWNCCVLCVVLRSYGYKALCLLLLWIFCLFADVVRCRHVCRLEGPCCMAHCALHMAYDKAPHQEALLWRRFPIEGLTRPDPVSLGHTSADLHCAVTQDGLGLDLAGHDRGQDAVPTLPMAAVLCRLGAVAPDLWGKRKPGTGGWGVGEGGTQKICMAKRKIILDHSKKQTNKKPTNQPTNKNK